MTPQLEYDQEAARLATAYRAVKEAARSLGIIDGDSSKDSYIPAEIKAALMAWATSINITLNRRGNASDSPSASAVPPETRSAAVHEPIFGSSRETKSGKTQYYTGKCRDCGKPAWVGYELDDPGSEDEHQCMSCWRKGLKR